MRIIQIEEILQLTFLPRFFPVNCYLVMEEDGLTLIDAAMPLSHKGIEEAASQLKQPIKRIVLTHAHGDHVGALDALKESHPDIVVYISKRDARLLGGDVSLDPLEPSTPIKGGVPKTLKTKADVLLHEGDRVGSLKAFETPGHTPGSLSFLDTRSNFLIAGDAFQTRGGVAVAGDLNWLFPFPAFGTWNKQVALESAKKISGLDVDYLAVGHGEILKSPKSQIKKAIKKLESKLD